LTGHKARATTNVSRVPNPRVTGLQAYTLVLGRVLEVAAEQLSTRELEALHEILIELVARHVEARRLREAA
jgi:hypothetical protein